MGLKNTSCVKTSTCRFLQSGALGQNVKTMIRTDILHHFAESTRQQEKLKTCTEFCLLQLFHGMLVGSEN